MRTTRSVGAVLALGVLAAAPLRAGVYNTAEPWPVPAEFQIYRQQLGALRGVAADLPNRLTVVALILTAEVSPPSPARPLRLLPFLQAGLPYLQRESLGLSYLRQVSRLEDRQQRGDLALEDRINLGAYYIRLMEYGKAIQILEPAAAMPHFMLLANLATAYELQGIPERAISYRQQALAAWPAVWAGWDSYRLHFSRKAEKYHLALTQLRLQETQQAGGQRSESLDALFPRVAFVGPSGTYEPGAIAPESWGEIPADACDLVMQLLLWLPLDNRLYWLLGELLNARGEVLAAADVLRELVEGRQYTVSRDLRHHYLVLQAARPAAEALARTLNPASGVQLLWSMTPRESIGALGPGPLFQEIGWMAALAQAEKRTGLAGPSVSLGSGVEPALPSWKLLVVSFQVGVVIGMLLVSLIGRQLRRFHQPTRQGSTMG